MIDSLSITKLNLPTVSEARLAGVLDAIADGVVIMDETGRILMFSKSCERLFGYSAPEVTGSAIGRLISFEYADGHNGYASHSSPPYVHFLLGVGRNVRGRHKDGTVFPLELSVGEVATPEGLQFIGVLHDVRQNNSAESPGCDFSGSDHLTPRERDVLKEIANGASNKEAGRKLGISPRTIEVHRARIMEKLGAKNAADLVRIVLTGAPRAQAKAG